MKPICIYLLVLGPLYAQEPAPPVILSAAIKAAANSVYINGRNLAPPAGNPKVLLNGIVLNVTSSTSTDIVAKLPGVLAAATYRLTVNLPNRTAVFDVTNGAVGPQGPVGPTEYLSKTKKAPPIKATTSTPSYSATPASRTSWTLGPP